MKPDYRVMTMAEINALPWNGYNVVSTFSGGGGSCTGYRMAGYKVRYANEFIEAARETYKSNHPDSFLDDLDIRAVSAERLLQNAGLEKGEIDLFDGSPPCASFSTSGSREKAWGKVKSYSDGEQRVDDLFFEYARLIEGCQPKVFIAENVSGLVKGTAKGYFKRILGSLRDCGYQVECRLLNSAYLGVPQARERTIFMGVRNDLGMKPVYPNPCEHIYSVADAFKNVPEATDPEENPPEKLSDKLHELWLATRRGDNFSEAHQRLYGNTSYFNWRKLSPVRPAATVMATNSMFHWESFRHLTIPEVKRIQSFPDDYVLTQGYMKRWERIGRSVPPVMMMNIAKTVQTEILDKCAA